MARRRLSRQRWVELIQEFEQSEETHAAFARRHRLRVTTFRRWLYQLRRDPPEQPVRFVELQAEAISTTPAMEIAVGRSVVLKLSLRIQPQDVVEIVAGLVNAGC